MNRTLEDNFADYVPPGRGPLRYEVRKGREEAQRRGEVFLGPPSTRNLAGDLESWWAELTPEQRLGEAMNLWQPEFATAGVLAKGGQRFFSFLTKVLEETVTRKGAQRASFKDVPDYLSDFVRPKGQKGVFVDLKGRSIGYTGLDAHGNTLDAIAEKGGLWEKYRPVGGEERFDIQREAKLIYSVWGGDFPHTYAAQPGIGSYDEVKNAVLRNMEDTGINHAVLEYGNKKEVIELGVGEKFPENLTGPQVLRRLQKLGVSKDELKYTGVGDYLTARGKEPVNLEELLGVARENELKMQVRELAFNESSEKDEYLMRLNEAGENLQERLRGEKNPKVREALVAGYRNLGDKSERLMTMEPKHGEGYYLGGYVLPNEMGLPPAGYWERLYEPNLPKGVEVEFTHRSNYPRAFAHARGEPRDFYTPEGQKVYGTMVEELQADTHENVAGYLTGDPFKDAPAIVKAMELRDPNMIDFHSEAETAAGAGRSYLYEFPGGAWARVSVDKRKNKYVLALEGENKRRETVVDEMEFKRLDDVGENLVSFLRRNSLDPTELLETWKGYASEGGRRLAADYPFKKDWYKLQIKDILKKAAADPNQKVVAFPTGEMMAERLGFGLKAGPTGEYIPASSKGEFAWELYEKKVPKFLEEEFGVKPVKGTTRTYMGGGQEMPVEEEARGVLYGEDMRLKGPTQDVPVWLIPLDPIREKVKKPLRLSWLSQQETEGLA